ncbi:MAG TPA: hypothetical protein VLJ62_00665, partial [Burkholderiaceae bacterium]|nr:hypothetical protein [Burkholderiaceae bacterium]
MQQQHRPDFGEGAVGEERDVAGDRDDPQRDHAAHAERHEHEPRRQVADRLVRVHFSDPSHSAPAATHQAHRATA